MDFKKLLLIFFLFVGLNTFAQNRLEFSQVVTLDTNYTSVQPAYNFTYYGIYYYVPAGKVWKIESSSTNGYFFINDVEVPLMVSSGSSGTLSSAFNPNFPIWLKSGDKIRYRWNGYCGNGNSCTATHNFFISIIEFNIVTD